MNATSAAVLTGREILTRVLKRQPADRIPWTPFVGCHGAALIGQTAREYLQSAKSIVEGARRAAERYRPDGLPVMFDLQIEAEALGCPLAWADDNPPAVRGHILETARLEDLPPLALDRGRIPLVFEAARSMRAALPDVALYGLVTGPFTLAAHLRGADLFIQMFDDPDGVRRLLEYCREAAERMAEGYIGAGCDVVAMVDPMTSQIGPEQFREFVARPARRLLERIRALGALSSFFVCGHAEKNIRAMCECAPDNVSIDENIPLDYVKRECLERQISFGGNMRLTTVLLMGDRDQCAAHAADCMKVGGAEGFVLAPGCDLPFSTPPENLEAVAETVHDPDRRRIAEELAAVRCETVAPRFDMREYGRADKVIVDVITLDSESCAPCQYMVESVRQVMPEFEDLVEWREHKIKQREGVEFMMSLMVRNVPTICIDGRIRFVSVIPPRDELIHAIQERINEKLRLKIRSRQTRITVLGAGCGNCEQAAANVRQAVEELGAPVDVERRDDPEMLASFGARHTPAVILTRSRLMSSGEIPEVRIVKEWIKDSIG